MNLLSTAVDELKELLGERVSTADIVREHHSQGESYHAPAKPDAVCFPATTAEVSGILKISQRHQLPVIPFGAGTSIEGHVNAIHGGISVDMSRMNRILRVSAEDLDATVEAGVTRKQLNDKVHKAGMMFPVDPGADATLGGMASTRASGTTTVRYGTMRENVLGLTVVMADGRIVRTGGRARKSSSGYDLTHLFVGAEGTLGVITELIVKLHPIPEVVAAAVCSFPSLENAVKTVIETIQLGVPAARMELLDEAAMQAVNQRSGTGYAIAPTLFFEFHGSNRRQVAGYAAMAQALVQEQGGSGFQWATELAQREKLWQARHEAYYSAMALRTGARGLTTDVCVPISKLAECILQAKQDHANAPFPIIMVSHAGDGNFHLIYALDPNDARELAEAKRLSSQLVERALAMGGTCSGEHGIGIGKLGYLRAEHGEAVDLMRAIKTAFDPDNRMNPGKLVGV